jgi:hypothetical protein
MKVIILSVTIFIVTLIAYSYYKSTILCNENRDNETAKCKHEIENKMQALGMYSDAMSKMKDDSDAVLQATKKQADAVLQATKKQADAVLQDTQKHSDAVLEAKQKEWKDIVDGLTTKKYDGDWVLLGSKNRSTYIHIDGNNVELIEGSELEPVSQAVVGAPTMAPRIVPVPKETKGKLYGDSIVFETKDGYQLTGNLRLNPSKQLILEMNMIGVDSSSSRSVRIFNKLNHGSTCNKLVLYDDQKGALNLADIVVYDIMGGTVPLTSQNVSMDDPWDSYPISNIVDNNENTFMHNNPNANNVRKITVTFDRSYVSIVVIRNRKDCCQTRANGLILKLFSSSNIRPDTSLGGFDSTKMTSEQISGETIYNYEVYSSYPVKDWSGSAVYENGGTNLNNPYGYNYIIFRTSNPEPIISNQFVY